MQSKVFIPGSRSLESRIDHKLQQKKSLGVHRYLNRYLDFHKLEFPKWGVGRAVSSLDLKEHKHPS